MTPLEEIKSTASGLAILWDWLGPSASPISRHTAQERANICETCPLNVSPNWWQKFKNSIAMAMRDQLAAKAKIGLELSNEAKLHVCKNCGCCIPLKVWVPIQFVRDHTSAEKMSGFHEKCWIRKELTQ